MIPAYNLRMAMPEPSLAVRAAARERRWIIIAVIVFLVVSAVGFLGFMFLRIHQTKQSEPFQLTMQALREDPRALELLGPSIKPHWLVVGGIKSVPTDEAGEAATDRPAKRADLMFTAVGSKSTGGVRSFATQQADGSWELIYMDLGLGQGSDGKEVVLVGTLQDRPK